MWSELVIHVADERVRLSVEHLDDEALERTAATVAWMALQTIDALEQVNHRLHQELYRQLSDHIAFDIPEDRLAGLDPRWWGSAIERACMEFLRANDLGPRIRHHARLIHDLRDRHASTPNA